MLTLLLEDGAEEAKKILAEFKPVFASAKEFLDYQDAIAQSGERIVYSENAASVTL